VNEFITEHYQKILTMSSSICKCRRDDANELAHYAIEQFLNKPNGQAIVDAGQGMLFLSGIIWRSYKSKTSPYHKLYRQNGMIHELYDKTAEKIADEPYDIEIDLTIESIQGILEDMLSDTVEQWYRATLFEMWLKESNFSELSRITGIPRTSISQAVQECKAYIKKRINNGTTT